MRLTQTQFMEIRRNNAAIHTFDLVHRHHDRTIDPAQQLGNIFVEWRYAFAAIDHEDNTIRFMDGLFGLTRHFLSDPFARFRLEATGINCQKAFAANLAMTVMAVTGKTRHIGNDRITRPCQAIKECRFANVGTAHQGDCRFHCKVTAIRDPPAVCRRTVLGPNAGRIDMTPPPPTFMRLINSPLSRSSTCRKPSASPTTRPIGSATGADRLRYLSLS